MPALSGPETQAARSLMPETRPFSMLSTIVMTGGTSGLGEVAARRTFSAAPCSPKPMPAKLGWRRQRRRKATLRRANPLAARLLRTLSPPGPWDRATFLRCSYLIKSTRCFRPLGTLKSRAITLHCADASETTRPSFGAFLRVGACNCTPSTPTVRCRSNHGSFYVRAHL
jgi:hypothetical protein